MKKQNTYMRKYYESKQIRELLKEEYWLDEISFKCGDEYLNMCYRIACEEFQKEDITFWKSYRINKHNK